MSPKRKAKESSSDRQVNTRLTSELFAQVEAKAAAENRSISNTFAQIVAEHFAKKASK